jgi:Ca-activated chloride channel family protein
MMRALGATEAGKRDDLRMAHVMLLSDGLANVGEKNPQALGQRAAAAFAAGVSISTFGVGLDYNEDLMTRLADQGGGRYHFIKDSEAIAGVLDDEMKGLVATVARGIEISFQLADGTKVSKVFGYATGTNDGVVTSRVGALAAQQTREMVVRLDLPTMKAGDVDLGSLSVAFKDVVADGVAQRVDVPVKLTVTDDEAASKKSERVEVTVRVAELEAADTLEIAARAADRGDFAGAGNSLQLAIDKLKAQVRATPSAKLSREIVDFEAAQGELVQARSSSRARKGYTKKFKARAYQSRKK